MERPGPEAVLEAAMVGFAQRVVDARRAIDTVNQLAGELAAGRLQDVGIFLGAVDAAGKAGARLYNASVKVRELVPSRQT